ncbi:hypothetical protein M8C21_021537 [Ambrosia artemisiifolia]|uniref:IBH1-like N-terminal domain-containing protein n=1 Tax=Ambrosia artemisiifolia TaxID=4212 RepID=A0AAD5CAT0_AMBAR|nr:hypothetical protein M8C21_021537 [Ambrosia artemisiifolia]
MSSSPQTTSTNSAYLTNQFAHRFVRALNNLNHTKTSSHGHNQISRRTSRVKIAAYTAMASVVGSRRAWSRAVLWKIRKRSRIRSLLLRMNRKRVDHKIFNCHHHSKVMSLKRRNPNPKRQYYFNPFRNSSQESKLRKLVPGAQTMDSWCLMGETADYIKCLAAQGNNRKEVQ